MPHYVFETNNDGDIIRVLKDGKPYEQSVRLEQAFAVVKIYFRQASILQRQMAMQQDRDERRRTGLQAFLMSLVGLEAFTNTFFHLRAMELSNDEMLKRVIQSHGTLSRKTAELQALTSNGLLYDQDRLLSQIFNLYQLRNTIVHPRWTPSALTIAGGSPITITGLVENQQAIFEDQDFCREALLWCLLAVARVGRANGNDEVSGFMFHWTGHYGLTLEMILSDLGLE